MTIKKIGIFPAGHFIHNRLLWETLNRLYPVHFQGVESCNSPGLDALLILEGDVSLAGPMVGNGVPRFVVVEGPGKERAAAAGTVKFGGGSSLAQCFRNREFKEEAAFEFSALKPVAGDELLAARGDRTFWACNRREGSVVHRVAAGPPIFEKGEYLHDHFRPARFLRLLPLLHFLRDVTKDIDGTPPPLRACLVFDDPNLWRGGYGCLDFRQLLEHARRHRYHAAIATVPLDSWRANSEVAGLFRENPANLSLLIHGNNHLKHELAHPGSESVCLQVLAQALWRIERLERRHGLTVARVMTPPHGVFALEMFPAMLKLGFEGALITTDLFLRHESHAALPAGFGFEMTEMLGGGLPAMARIRVAGDWESEVCFAAFRHQPMLLCGHHQDAEGDMDYLARIADLVNSLGEVRWSGLSEITRSNYKLFPAGDSLTVRMYGRRSEIDIPAGIRAVRIERPWIENDSQEELAVTCQDGARLFRVQAGPAVELFPTSQAPQRLELRSLADCAVNPDEIAPLKLGPWIILRRFMTEARDRTYPLRRLFAGKQSSRGRQAWAES